MANLEHIKGSRTQILNGFPSNSFGNDGDIVTANIKGKGVYLCIKNNSRWFVADKLNDLRQLDRPTMQNLTLNSLSIKSSNLTTSNATGDFTLDVNGDIALSADGGNVTMDDGTTTIFDFDVDGVNLKIMDDANTSDYFNIAVGAEGATTISTVDADTTVAHLTLNADGDILLNANGGDISFQDGVDYGVAFDIANHRYFFYGNNTNYLRFIVGTDGDTSMETVDSDGTAGHLTIAPNGVLKTEADDGGIFIKETADAGTDANGYGQIWVHDTNPVELCFTDQDGTDIIGIGKYHYDIKFIGYAGSGTASYLPINGYVFDQTSTSSRNEYHSFIAPYNGTIQKVAFRSEVAQDGDLSFRVLESADGTEIPGTTIFRHETTVDIADDIYQELDMTGPGTGCDYSPLTKGRIYVFYLSCPSAPLDTNITVVFKWDITS